MPVAVFGPSLGHARAHAPAAAAAMAAQWRWWRGDWWVWDDNQYDWVHGGPSLDQVRAAAAKAAAVAAAPKQPAAVPKPIGLPFMTQSPTEGPPAAAAQPGAGAAVAAGPAAAAGPPAAAAQAAGRHWDIRTQAAGPPAAAQPPGLAYGKTWVQRPSGLWEEAPAAAAAAAAPAAFPAAAAGPRAAAAGPGAGAAAAVAAGPAAAAGPQRRRGVAGPPQGPLWDGAVPAPAVAAPRAGPGPGSAGSAGPADAAAAGPAVADGPYDLAFFQGIQTFSANYQQHNAALKWFRHRLENSANRPARLFFSNTEPTPVAGIVKGAGMDWDFAENRSHDWSWFEMVAQLDAESMAFVVNGAEGRSCGLVSCSFALRPNSYDHKRHHQLRVAGTPKKDAKVRVWDFVLTRVDGSAVRLHPQWSTTDVESYAVEGHAEEVEIPAHGLGESDGPGTYRHFKDLGTQRRLKFDGTKRPR